MHRWYIKLYRCSVENELYFSEKFTKRQARQDIILNANYKDKTFFIRGNEIKLKRWQIWRSEITMSERWGRSRNKVRRFLKWLKTKQQIEQQKCRYITTIITILWYNKYQNDTTDDTAERQQTIHKQEGKERKEGKEKTIIEKTLKDFYSMRIKIKAPMTDRAKTLLNNILNKLAWEDEDLKIKMLEQSIMNSWKSVFPIKWEQPPPQTDQQRLDEFDKLWDNWWEKFKEKYWVDKYLEIKKIWKAKKKLTLLSNMKWWENG